MIKDAGEISTAPGPARSEHVQAKRDRRRRQILQAALEAVRERGYHATTLDDIAERLGIRKTALYHYFPDKDAILYECHRGSLAELDRLIEESALCCSGPVERLEYLVREHVRVMTETLAGSPLAFEVPALSGARRAEIVAGRDRYERVLRGLIAEGIRGGQFREQDPRVVVFAILGAINWISRWYRPGGRLSARALGEQFSLYLVGGLR
ncbi:MAG TPA: TetR/AcrR family transcriptional regulator [Longimicrobiales bacterium]|nr:TetR/AcrR family transcriptional regulator [Longimicrobiales bacterium]